MMKLTEWYPPHVKPVRPGVYQVAYFGKGNPSYARWDGKVWSGSFCIAYIYMALELAHRCADRNSKQSLPWRGLAADPT